MNITLGCDPELFMADVEGKLRAACGRIGGTKAKPQPLEELGDGFAVQEDNVAIEYNIPPAANAEEFVRSITRAMQYLNDGVNNMYGYHIVNLSAASFPKDELLHPAAKEFGCDPDYNAWTGRKNPRPKADDETLRSCGGHVHVGYHGDADKRHIIRCMDFYLGVPSVLMDQGEKRKQLYGKRGAYRDKPYGVEYRTLSNFWVFSPKHVEWVFNNTVKAVAAAEAQFAVDEYDDMIRAAIDDNDKGVAYELCSKFNLEVIHA